VTPDDDADLVPVFHRTDDTGQAGIQRIGFLPTGVADRAGKACFLDSWATLDRFAAHGRWVVIVTLPRSLMEACRCEDAPDEIAVPVGEVNARRPFAYRLYDDGEPSPPELPSS
jgi:hypothetical protein